MTHDVQLFKNTQIGSLRVLTIEEEPWFVLADITKALGLTRRPAAVADRLDDDVRQTYPITDTLGRTQNAILVNEAGLYETILRSDAPLAKAFRRWVTHEVLPAIRKHGGYIRPDATEHQVNALIAQARMRMELCQAARGLIHPDHLEAKARVILAQGMGEHAVLDPGRAPLYTQDFLKSKNLSKTQLRKIAGTFGKRVKAAYVLEHGTEPGKYPLSLPNGQTREVYAYTEADRALMQNVWNTHYGN